MSYIGTAKSANTHRSLRHGLRSAAIATQVQSLPGALPAQMVRPAAGKVTWLLDSDSASAIGADAWIDNAKAFPRSNMVGGKKPTGATGEAQ